MTELLDQPGDSGRLLEQIASGSREAFAVFYDRFSAPVFGLIRRIVRSEPAAEEVLQDVFWQVWERAGDYDPARGSPEAWLYTRARSRALDRLRAKGSREVPSELTEAVATDPASTADDRRMAETALAQLSEAQRTVIELSFFGGLTHSEIARKLGEPLGTVKTRVRSGLERLRTIYSAERA